MQAPDPLATEVQAVADERAKLAARRARAADMHATLSQEQREMYQQYLTADTEARAAERAVAEHVESKSDLQHEAYSILGLVPPGHVGPTAAQLAATAKSARANRSAMRAICNGCSAVKSYMRFVRQLASDEQKLQHRHRVLLEAIKISDKMSVDRRA